MPTAVSNIYQILGDYFTGTFRRGVLSVITAEIYFGIIIICYKLNIEAPKDTLDLVFSSIIQALLSLVALLGVAAFFKLEALRNEADKIIQLATETNPPYHYPWLATKLEGKLIGSGEQLMTAFDAILKEGEPQEPSLRFLKIRLEEIFYSKRHVTTYILNFTILTFFTVMLSLFLLIIAPFLVSYHFSIVSLVIIFYLLSNCLFLVIKGMADAVYY